MVLAALLAINACDDKEEELYEILLPIDGSLMEDFVGDTATVYRHDQAKHGYAILTSEKEFEKYFGDDDYIEKIDFGKSNMLVASGTSNYGVAYVLTRVDEDENGGYHIGIMVQQNMLCVIEPWMITAKIPKEVTKENAKIEAWQAKSRW